MRSWWSEFTAVKAAVSVLVDSVLALWAPVGAPANELVPLNGCAADEAWLICASVDRCLASVVAIHAFQVAEIAERGAASANAALQH